MITSAQYAALMTPEAIAQRAAAAEQNRLANARRFSAQNDGTRGILNPGYNPGRGNVRYDHTQYGSGANAIKYIDDARKVFETYQALTPNQKGYENAQNYLGALRHNTGITDWTRATNRQLFEAIDDTFRGYQEDNKKENFKFGLVDAAKLAAAAGATVATAGAAAPYFGATLGGTVATGALAGAVGATTSGVLNDNLSLRGVATGAALGGIGGAGKYALTNARAAGAPFHAGALGKGFTSSSLYSPSSLGATGATGAGVTGLGGGAYTAGKGMMNASALFNPSVAANWASMPIGTAARYGNAVAGARTGINSALPGMGGGLTTAQGAGTAALRTPQTGLNSAIMHSGQSGAAASSPATWMGTSAASLYNPVSLGGTPSPTWMQRGMNALDRLMQSDVLSQIAGGNQAAAARLPTRYLAAPGVGRGSTIDGLPIPTTGIREALAQQAAKRLKNTGGLTRLTPIQSGLLRL